MVSICLLVVITLLLVGAYELNILPKFNKLKGEVVCSSIPAKLQPYDVVNNPEGLHEYGFTDIKFYNAIINHGVSSMGYTIFNESYCTSMSENDLRNVKELGTNDKIDSVNGIQYLTEMYSLNLGVQGHMSQFLIKILLIVLI